MSESMDPGSPPFEDSTLPAPTALQAELPPVLSAPPRSTLRWIFIGSDGLRAGWSLLLFLAIAAALGFAVSAAVMHFHPAAKDAAKSQVLEPTRTIIQEATSFAVLAIAAWIMSFIERRNFGLYGLGGTRRITDFFQGLFFGILAISAVIGCLLASHLIAFDGVALHGAEALRSGLLWGTGFILVGFLEEFMTRGYIQYTVTRGISGLIRSYNPQNANTHALGFWITASLFSAALFMGLHLANHGETPVGILAVGAAGLTFAYSLWRTGYLWWAIGFHAAWDWGQTYLYGVADSGLTAKGHLLNSHPTGNPLLSGGSTGPEGSVFVLPALALVCVVIHLTLPRRAYPLTPSQQPPEPSETM